MRNQFIKKYNTTIDNRPGDYVGGFVNNSLVTENSKMCFDKWAKYVNHKSMLMRENQLCVPFTTKDITPFIVFLVARTFTSVPNYSKF